MVRRLPGDPRRPGEQPANTVNNVILRDLEELRRRLAPHVRGAIKAVAFGSVARGEPDEWSDLDLLIITRTTRPFFERFKDFYRWIGHGGRL